MNLIPLPAFDDNYSWLLHDGAHAIVIDPGEAGVVEAALDQLKLKLDAILVTHHHADHTGGVQDLQLRTGAHVYGPGSEFEGTPDQMLDSLDKLSALPGNTVVCCAHEYTLANLKFANAVEPNNFNLVNHTQLCQSLRANQQPTLSNTIETERQIYPFLRSRETTVCQAIQAHAPHNSTLDDVQAFAILREWKNKF